MICAGLGGRNSPNTCHGDSGSPLLCATGSNGRWVIHGINSWGDGTCNGIRYDVFARVAAFRSWIDQTTRNN